MSIPAADDPGLRFETPLPRAYCRAEPWRKVLQTDPCAYCGSPHAGTVDHIHPKGRGGAHAAENTTGACEWCNSKKADERDILTALVMARLVIRDHS